MPNTYKKFCPNVYIAQCAEKHGKGDIIEVETTRGKIHECIVFNLVSVRKDGTFWYSVVRSDGFNHQEWARKRAEKLQKAANNSKAKSGQYWKASSEGREFLSLGQPILVGHHSEKRHRALIERNHNRIDNAIRQEEKAKEQESRAEYWERRANEINLSMPESIEYYEFKLEQAKIKHAGLKNGTIKRDHSFSLTYAKKELNEMQKKYDLAKLLWGESEQDQPDPEPTPPKPEQLTPEPVETKPSLLLPAIIPKVSDKKQFKSKKVQPVLHNSKSIDGEIVQSKITRYKTFDSAYKLKMFLDTIDSKNKSMYNTTHELGLTFAVPAWIKTETGETVYFNYDYDNCTSNYNYIEQCAVSLLLPEIALSYITRQAPEKFEQSAVCLPVTTDIDSIVAKRPVMSMGAPAEICREIVMIKKKIARKQISLDKAKEKSLNTFKNLGFGAGMRKTKLVSFSKEDSLQLDLDRLNYELILTQSKMLFSSAIKNHKEPALSKAETTEPLQDITLIAKYQHLVKTRKAERSLARKIQLETIVKKPLASVCVMMLLFIIKCFTSEANL